MSEDFCPAACVKIELPNLYAGANQVPLCLDVMGCQANTLAHVLQDEEDAAVVLGADAKEQHHFIHVPQLCTGRVAARCPGE